MPDAPASQRPQPGVRGAGRAHTILGRTWQIVPSVLGALLGSKDPERAMRAMRAMLQMTKLDIAALRRAADGA
jgi:hypothetical protein